MASYQIHQNYLTYLQIRGLYRHKKLRAMLGKIINRTSWSLASNHTSPRFDLRSVHVGFVYDKVAVGQISLPELTVFPVSITLTMLHSHTTQPHVHNLTN